MNLMFTKEIIRTRILVVFRMVGSQGMTPTNAAVLICGSFPGVTKASVLEDVDYLSGKGMLEYFASPISAGDKRVRITSAGIDYLEANPV